MMKPLKHALLDIAEKGSFTATEAHSLLQYNWHQEIGALSGTLRTEAETLCHFTQGMLEEIREGYAIDEHSPEMLLLVASLARNLPESQ